MNRKIKKFLHEYRNALILAAIVCIPLIAILYFFVPRDTGIYNDSEIGNENQDLVMEALAGNKSVSCTFKGSMSGNAYIDNGEVRVVATGQNILYSNDKVYLWDSASSSGRLIDIQKFPLAKSFINAEEIKKQIDKYQPDCKEDEVDEKRLIPDPGVQFNDYTPSLGEVMKMNQ